MILVLSKTKVGLNVERLGFLGTQMDQFYFMGEDLSIIFSAKPMTLSKAGAGQLKV